MASATTCARLRASRCCSASRMAYLTVRSEQTDRVRDLARSIADGEQPQDLQGPFGQAGRWIPRLIDGDIHSKPAGGGAHGSAQLVLGQLAARQDSNDIAGRTPAIGRADSVAADQRRTRACDPGSRRLRRDGHVRCRGNRAARAVENNLDRVIALQTSQNPPPEDVVLLHDRDAYQLATIVVRSVRAPVHPVPSCPRGERRLVLHDRHVVRKDEFSCCSAAGNGHASPHPCMQLYREFTGFGHELRDLAVHTCGASHDGARREGDSNVERINSELSGLAAQAPPRYLTDIELFARDLLDLVHVAAGCREVRRGTRCAAQPGRRRARADPGRRPPAGRSRTAAPTPPRCCAPGSARRTACQPPAPWPSGPSRRSRPGRHATRRRRSRKPRKTAAAWRPRSAAFSRAAACRLSAATATCAPPNRRATTSLRPRARGTPPSRRNRSRTSAGPAAASPADQKASSRSVSVRAA